MKIARFHAESSQMSDMVTLLADALTGKAGFTSRFSAGGYHSTAGRDEPASAASASPAARSPGIFEWIDRWFWRQQQRDRDAWLGQSGDVFELEDRLRALERRVGSRYF